MDHQVEDDVHISSPFEKRMETVGFDEEGVPHHGMEGDDGRVEPFNKSDLEDQPLCIGQGDQFVGFGQGGGDRFFQEDVHSRLEKRMPSRGGPVGTAMETASAMVGQFTAVHARHP